jgi:hypothetical protein
MKEEVTLEGFFSERRALISTDPGCGFVATLEKAVRSHITQQHGIGNAIATMAIIRARGVEDPSIAENRRSEFRNNTITFFTEAEHASG